MKKGKIVYVLLTVLILNIVLPVVASAKVTDVPVDHWAYHSVNTAVTKGYFTVFEDGSFQGTRAVDRYTLSNVIARLLEEIEVARVKGTSGDLTAISEFRLRFEEDLAAWYANQQSLRDEVKNADAKAVIYEERVNRVTSAQVNLEEQVDDLRGKILALQSNVTEVQTGVGVQTGNISENELRLSELLNAVIQLEKEITVQGEAINSLENWAGEKGAVFAALQSTDSKMTTDLSELAKLNQQLEKDLTNLAVMLKQETQKRTELADELEATKGGLETAQADIILLRNDKSVLEDLKKQLSTDVNAQINAALIREQRLERQIKTIEEEFATYRETADKDVKSAKTLAMVAIALGAIGAVIGAINLGK